MSNNIDNETLEHLKKVELSVLKDFMKICDENNIDYYITYGTLIGAIRHEGFIPWDDDIDVMMLRKDYEKFLEVIESKNLEQYEILDGRYQNDYFLLFGKMSLKGTNFAEFWDKQVSFTQGIYVDLFVLDNVPDNNLKRFFFKKHCFLIDKLLTMATIKLDDSFSTPVRIISNAMHTILNSIGLKPKYFQKRARKLFTKYDGKKTEYVCDLTEESQFMTKLSDLQPPKKVKFEDTEVKIPNNYDKILRDIYGDYMQIPPEDERITHVLDVIDFGKY